MDAELELQIAHIDKLIASDVPLHHIVDAYSRLGQYVYWQHKLAASPACKHTTITIEPDDTLACIDCHAQWKTLEAYYRARLENMKEANHETV
jgi:hypothetical protein